MEDALTMEEVVKLSMEEQEKALYLAALASAPAAEVDPAGDDRRASWGSSRPSKQGYARSGSARCLSSHD